MFSRRHITADILGAFCLLAGWLISCVPLAPSPTPMVTATSSVVPTMTDTVTPTSTPRTPPVLPGLYQNGKLTPFGSPRTYIQNTCQYLIDKWSSNHSAPGTVVMAIMFHSITREAVTSSDQISEDRFRILMNTLHDNGFQAITTSQMLDFMETNAKIPERSVLLIVDDRRTAEYFNLWFREYWEMWGWKVVNAWISLDDSKTTLYLPENVVLENEGWVDHQAHGFIHNIPIGPGSSEEYILGELQKPIDFFKLNFKKTPIAVIWPGGGFTPHAAVVARQLGYRLGFTTNPRGPVMFDWIPLRDTVDPQSPTWLADGTVNDPLMVLPRFWDTDAIIHIPQVIQIGQEAAAYAAENKTTEIEYYDIVCSPTYGPIP